MAALGKHRFIDHCFSKPRWDSVLFKGFLKFSFFLPSVDIDAISTLEILVASLNCYNSACFLFSNYEHSGLVP